MTRGRTESFYESDEDNEDYTGKPPPNMLADDDDEDPLKTANGVINTNSVHNKNKNKPPPPAPPPPPPAAIEDNTTQSQSPRKSLQHSLSVETTDLQPRRRSRSFFDQDDMLVQTTGFSAPGSGGGIGAKSTSPKRPPQVPGRAKEEVKVVKERTGKLSPKELKTLRLGLDTRPKITRHDSDLDVDVEFDLRQNIPAAVTLPLHINVNDRFLSNRNSGGSDRNSGGSSDRNSGGGKGKNKGMGIGANADFANNNTPSPTATNRLSKKLNSLSFSPSPRSSLIEAPLSLSVKPNRKIKLLMLGDSNVGKTSLMSRYTLDKFTQNNLSTMGVDFKVKTVSLCGENVNVQVWDTAGQERFRKITHAYYKGAGGIILVYDVGDRTSFSNVDSWMKAIREYSLGSVFVAVVGNKTDLRDSAEDGEEGKYVKREEGENMLNSSASAPASAPEGDDSSRKIAFYETSAKDNSGVDECFLSLIQKVVKSQLETEANNGEGARESSFVGVGGGGRFSEYDEGKSYMPAGSRNGNNSSLTPRPRSPKGRKAYESEKLDDAKKKHGKFHVKSPKIVKGIVKGVKGKGECCIS